MRLGPQRYRREKAGRNRYPLNRNTVELASAQA
jgi:hypothetical protein